MIDAGPTAVHCSLDSASVWPSVKMRKLAADVIAARLAQPGGRQRLLEAQRPAVETCPVPPLPVVEFWMTSVQVPWAFRPCERRRAASAG